MSNHSLQLINIRIDFFSKQFDNEDQNEIEFSLITPDYTKTEGSISMCGWNDQDGLTISLQHIWSTLALSLLLNRTFILSTLPSSAIMRDKREFLPFIDLFDINILRKAYGPNCCISSDEIFDQKLLNASRIEGNYNSLLDEFRNKRTELNAHKHIQVCGAPYELLIKANITSVYENTQPHPFIKKIIRYALQTLRNRIILQTRKIRLICMHLRTESDLMYFFLRSPAIYTQEQILAKIKMYQEYFLIKPIGFLLSKIKIRCKKADIFIGNNHSSLSERQRSN